MRQALGKGLDALIPKAAPVPEASLPQEAVKIAIDKIRPNHLQPRKNFDAEQLSELAASIKEHGLAQPILVSYDAQAKSYEIIAGERRWRAAQLAGLTEIPVVVRNPATEKERLALALIENIQRADLNAIETALGYLRLMKEAQISQTDLTRLVGKSKSSISNTLRLLDLPDDMQKAVQFEKISEGHARALLMVENPHDRQKLFNMMLEQKLSVRDVEDIARAMAGTPEKEEEEKSARKPLEKSADIRALESDLQRRVGTKVEIKAKRKPWTGSVVLHYYSLTDFDKILEIIKK